MPSQTFFNLPEKKRERITQLAITEFAAADYDNASITNIVKQAKIAKGSFYQYFEDKKDLYLYLIDLASQQRIAFIQAAQAQLKSTSKNKDFFEELRQMFMISTQFNAQHPQLNQIINRANYGESSVKEVTLDRVLTASKQPVHALVDKGLESGDLRADLDPDLATFIILTASNSLRYFIPEKLKLDTRQIVERGQAGIDMQAVEQIFDQLILVFERGMGRF